MKTNRIQIGSIIASNVMPGKMFMVLQKKQNREHKYFVCIPIINKKDRQRTDRYVYEIGKLWFAVLNKSEIIYDYTVNNIKAPFAKQIVEAIQKKYKEFNPNPRGNFTRYVLDKDDAYRIGNPWEGLSTMSHYPVVYRG